MDKSGVLLLGQGQNLKVIECREGTYMAKAFCGIHLDSKRWIAGILAEMQGMQQFFIVRQPGMVDPVGLLRAVRLLDILGPEEEQDIDICIGHVGMLCFAPSGEWAEHIAETISSCVGGEIFDMAMNGHLEEVEPMLDLISRHGFSDQLDWSGIDSVLASGRLRYSAYLQVWRLGQSGRVSR